MDLSEHCSCFVLSCLCQGRTVRTVPWYHYDHPVTVLSFRLGLASLFCSQACQLQLECSQSRPHIRVPCRPNMTCEGCRFLYTSSLVLYLLGPLLVKREAVEDIAAYQGALSTAQAEQWTTHNTLLTPDSQQGNQERN